MKKLSGYFNLYWSPEKGKLYLEIDRWKSDFLYVVSLPRGIGSNDIGLDRGQLGRERVVHFRRVGPKVLMIQPNLSYRAETKNKGEQQAVEESFAKSILWGFNIVAEGKEKSVLVDATNFVLKDAHQVSQKLKKANEGTYTLDASRSVVELSRTRGFPRNTEIEVMLTFTGKPTGKHLQTVTPTPESLTVHQRHSLIRLPDDNYQPRKFHPQCGFFWTQYVDYSARLGEPIDVRLITRHRLQKKNPKAEVSEPINPIVYYLDRGTPEPVRSALLEGARWWSNAFESAGFRNAFRVELLPEDADPMDVRYNVIQWVHRSTRGWSYGSSIVDPRTGEIIKGHVTLGSLRVRQDMVIAEGLLSPFEKGNKVSESALKMALARLRQLSAHEVGHTLGLAHNFAASVKGNASVMDYPHPYLVEGTNGKLDLSQAYSVGVGAWDKVAIGYGYREFQQNENDEKKLTGILDQARKEGLTFISDVDARPVSGAHPTAHLWDNGADPVKELERILPLRARALKRFSEQAIPEGTPLCLLEERFVPVYLLHRYQVEAVVKLLGGVQYEYNVRGDKSSTATIVNAEHQLRALKALSSTLNVETLAVPEKVLRLIPPRAQGFPIHRELFPRKSGPTLDPFAVSEGAADHTLKLILNPARCSRLIEQHVRNPKQPGLGKVLDTLLKQTWPTPTKRPYRDAIRRVVDNALLYRLMNLAESSTSSDLVKGMVHLKLEELKTRITTQIKTTTDPQTKAHELLALRRLQQFEKNPERIPIPKPRTLPPGSPIGACACGSSRMR